MLFLKMFSVNSAGQAVQQVVDQVTEAGQKGKAYTKNVGNSQNLQHQNYGILERNISPCVCVCKCKE